ncbi:MAG: hypothetical protein STSR0008_09380 [Ignavibacterium sp.]
MKRFLYILIPFLFFGCTATKTLYYDEPIELKDEKLLNKFIQDNSKYFIGKKFFLDPGHGGSDRRSKGYKGKVVEADANLKVALYLRDLLKQAGAVVIMSRDKDMTVDLKQRSIMANKSGADFFISIHHNAPGKEGDNITNYTSTYYHATESDYEYEPMERDLAKYVQRDLAYAMRNSGGLGSFDGTYSDYIIYPKQGFAVLRQTEIPSILVECGFFTHYMEEERLALEKFNRIEAFGIFRGLFRYLKSSTPQIEFMMQNFASEDSIEFFYDIKDSVTIDSNSVVVYFDSVKTQNFEYDSLNKRVKVKLINPSEGEHSIRIIAQNKNGNHSFPFDHKIQITKTKI